MAWTAKAWTATILALVILSLTVAPTWPMAFLILVGMIASQVVAVAKNTSFLPVSRQAPALADHATALTDDADVDGWASADDTAGGMRRKPEPSSISSSLSGFKYDVYSSSSGSDACHRITDCLKAKLADVGIRVFRNEDELIEYLSSSGSDACHGITDCLKAKLADLGIQVFRREDELIEGKEISPALEKAIKQSRISIAILSRTCASSKSCLDELVQMWECMKLNGQTVLPILYEVSPADLRHQAGNFGRSFNLLKADGVDLNTIKAWKKALRRFGNRNRFGPCSQKKFLPVWGEGSIRMTWLLPTN